MIASRLRRQAILYEPGRDITLLIGEAALHTRLATPVSMLAQLDHLARLAETLTTAKIPSYRPRRGPDRHAQRLGHHL